VGDVSSRVHTDLGAVSERTCLSALAMFAAVWFALVATSSSLTSFPVVLSDEANYLLPTLFGYRGENYERWGIIPQIPNLLYYRIYATFAGPDIYFWAKLLNAAFVVTAAAPAYATARIYLRPCEAAVFSVAVICTPMDTFARYFMPESLYYFGFWCVVWVLLRAPTFCAGAAPLAVGIALGFLSLVKPHALALLLAAGLFFLLRRPRVAEQLLEVAILVSCFYAARVGAAYVLSGIWDFSLSGPAYRAVLSLFRYAPGPFLVNAFGHVASLILLAGLPLLAVGLALFHDLRHTDAPDAALRDLMLLALATLFATLSMTVYFSFVAYLSDPDGEQITRLHGRYYAYVLPLTILAYVAMVRRQREPAFLFSNIALLTFAVAMALAAFILARLYETSIVDYPELGILPRWPGGAQIVVIAGIVCLGGAWILRGRRFPGDRVRRALPVAWWAVVVFSTSALVLVAPLTGRWLVPNDIDRAMMNDSVLQNMRQRADGLVVGTNDRRVDTYRVMFHLASLSRGRFIARDAVLDNDAIPSDVNWLILLPGVSFSGTGEIRKIGPLGYVKLR
jgi:hypothetical protein